MAGNPWQVQQAAEELNAFFTDNADALSDANDLLWGYIYTAVKQVAVGIDMGTPLTFEMWRTTYNSATAASVTKDTRTIPPTTGTDSAMRTAAESVTDFNATSPNPLADDGVSQPLSGTQNLAVADYFYLKGVENAKKQGWNDTFKNIWDGAMEQASLQVAASLLRPGYDKLADNTVPLQQLSATAQFAAWRGRTSVVLGTSAARYVTYLGGSDSGMIPESPTVAADTSLVRTASGTLGAGYAVISGAMWSATDVEGTLVASPATTLIDAAHIITATGTLSSAATVSGVGVTGTFDIGKIDAGGSFAIAAASSTVAADASLIRTASGAPTSSVATTAVSAIRIGQGSGTPASSVATTAVSTIRIVQGSGAPSVARPTTAGAGEVETPGFG